MNYDIHLGVTGLRRTGKTVFLTALVYQLTQLGSKGLSDLHNRGIQLKLGQFGGAIGGTKFPFKDNLRNLREEDPPIWPPPTRHEFEGSITFRYVSSGSTNRMQPLLSRLGWDRREGSITIHVHDYPGEFLLDVELAKLSFRNWSESALERMQDQCPEQYSAYVGKWRSLIFQHSQSMDSGLLSSLRSAYAGYVLAAREHRFEMIQPGIALDGWDIPDAKRNGPIDPGPDVLPILPICDWDEIPEPIRNQLERAYNNYVAERVKPFIARLNKSTHQVVLVDVLRVVREVRARKNGHKCFNDTRECLARIISAYSYADQDLWGQAKRLLQGGIRRIIFAATKADHVLKSDRTRLTNLLSDLVEEANGHLPSAARFCWFSSLCATEDRVDGQGEDVLWGKRLGESVSRGWNPGALPDGWHAVVPESTQSDSGNSAIEFPDFAPPQFPKINGTPLPHLQLDRILWHLLDGCC